jgi:hypothetical protein
LDSLCSNLLTITKNAVKIGTYGLPKASNLCVSLCHFIRNTFNLVREDIAMMFGQFHIQKTALGAKVLRLNKEKGWLVPPPL